ncbi:MAG TPA: alpha/beta hydrolase [Methanocella sp.]|jgi:pimeloyl-ACP methyl ester carboxylesterase
MEKSEFNPFVSADAKRQYLSMYDEKAKNWPVPSETRMIDTTYGQTFVRISGPAGAPPLVLLPGMGSDSLSWIPYARALSGPYRIYAVDAIGNYGRSIPVKDLTVIDDYMSWLDELLTAMQLRDGISLTGMSYGGMLAGQYALRHPERLRKVVLLAPAATVLPTSQAFTLRLISSLLPARFFTKRLYFWLYEDFLREDPANRAKAKEIVDEKILAGKSFRRDRPVPPAIMTDEELQGIKVPVLYVVGEHEKIYSAVEAIARLKKVAPQIRTEVIPRAGHDLNLVRAEMVNRIVLDFLGSRDVTGSA